MEMNGKIIAYSGFTPSNLNHVTIEVIGMENYFGNVIKLGDEVALKHGTEDKKAPVDRNAVIQECIDKIDEWEDMPKEFILIQLEKLKK